MRLFHGSNMSISEIDLSKSMPNKDFGRAFYLSDTYEQAFHMASLKSSLRGGTPIVTEFEYSQDESLKILQFDSYTEEWANFIFLYRDAIGEYHHGYDIVYGPIANDRIGLQIINLKDNYIDLKEFLRRIKYFKGITFQYAFCTPKSVQYLKPLCP